MLLHCTSTSDSLRLLLVSSVTSRPTNSLRSILLPPPSSHLAAPPHISLIFCALKEQEVKVESEAVKTVLLRKQGGTWHTTADVRRIWTQSGFEFQKCVFNRDVVFLRRKNHIVESGLQVVYMFKILISWQTTHSGICKNVIKIILY